MKKIKTKHLICITLLVMLGLCSCSGEDKNEEPLVADYEEYLVVINKADMVPVKVEYDIRSETTEEALAEILESLVTYTDDKYSSPISGNVKINSWTYSDNEASVYFDATYYEMLISDEVLTRSAIVESLCQLEDIEDVYFFVDDAPLTINGAVIGRMNGESFLYDLSGGQQMAELTLYYADMEIGGLLRVEREVTIDARYTDEQMVIEQLLLGPGPDSGLVSAIPEGTKLLNVVTKDMVCYVNLSSEFLQYSETIPDSYTIYSIVNTLCQLNGVRNVVFSVDGVKLEYYKSVNCNELLSMNYDLILNKGQ